MPRNAAESGFLVIDDDEIDKAGLEKRVRVRIDLWRRLQDANRIDGTVRTENK